MSFIDQPYVEAPLTDGVLILPALNEASRLGGDPFKQALDANMEAFSERFIDDSHYRMIVVDDGSTDNTGEVAENFGYEVVRHERNLGKGAAIRTGVRAVLDGMVNVDPINITMAFTDADGSYSPATVLELMQLARGNSNLAIARRQENELGATTLRSFGHLTVKGVLNTMLPTGVRDPQAGAMAFTGPVIELWAQSTSNGFIAPAEVLYEARKKGMKAVQLTAPITPVGESRVKPSDAVTLFRDAARIRLAGRKTK